MGKGELGGAFDGTQGSSAIHQDKQDKHIVGSKNYKQEVAQGRTPSVLTADPGVLLAEGVGNGYKPSPTKEVVDYGMVVGKYYDLETKQYYETTRATIHYDTKKKAHIVPALPIELMKRGKK